MTKEQWQEWLNSSRIRTEPIQQRLNPDADTDSEYVYRYDYHKNKEVLKYSSVDEGKFTWGRHTAIFRGKENKANERRVRNYATYLDKYARRAIKREILDLIKQGANKQ